MKNLKLLIELTIICFTIFNATAQVDANSLLWKVEGENIKTSYVFGTFHILPEKDFVLKDKVTNAFNVSQLVVLELDMDDPNLQSNMMKVSMLDEGESLKTFMDENEYNVLDLHFKGKMGVGMENFTSFKPMVLSTMVMMSYLGEGLASYEATLIKLATEQNKEILGLETIEFQMSIFDEQPYDEQIDDIVKLLTEQESMKTMFDKMIALYKAEDISGLYDFMDDYFDGDIALQERMLANRNNNWIPKIREFSKDQSVFYGVGAGHLGGKTGVINLLKEAGYTVTPVID